jgi:hypothetical protein
MQVKIVTQKALRQNTQTLTAGHSTTSKPTKDTYKSVGSDKATATTAKQQHLRNFKMTEYTKADYLAACGAIWDGKPTEVYFSDDDGDRWELWPLKTPPLNPELTQWRPVDPTRKYREAFAAGKRVEWMRGDGSWFDVKEYGLYIGGENPDNFRIVEPKTVKLFPFAYKECEEWRHSGYHATIQDAASWHESGTPIVPINADGSIEVES